MSRDLILGIDGGGSKVQLMLADMQGRIVKASRGGGVNPVDNRNWRAILEAELSRFSDDGRIGAVAAALPAYGEVEAFSAQQRDVIAVAFPNIPQRVLNDVDAAHLGAFAGGAGILILSGTGSMAWARDAADRSYRVGGWGETIGDEGSAHWIGRNVLSRISQAIDGRAGPTAMVEAVLDHLGIEHTAPMDGLEAWVAHQDNHRAAIASLSALAGRLADAGDAGAIAIMDAAAEELARHFTAIARQAKVEGPWSYAGGTFACRSLLEAVSERIGKKPMPPKLLPIGGALFAAAQELDWPVPPAWIEGLAASIDGLPAGADGLQSTK